MSKRFKESSERDEGTGPRSLLSRLSSQHLKSIKVAICRHNVPEPTSPVVVQRALEDPNELVIHRREGEGQHPIFDRRGIVVNVEKHLEERIVLKSPVRTTAEEGSLNRSHSKTYSNREPSAESDISGSPRNRRGYSSSPSASSRKDPKRKPGHSKEYGRIPKVSPSRGKQKTEKEEYREKRHTEGSSSTKRSNRSVSPVYKRNETDRYESRNYMSPKERYYRERSPKPGPSKSSRERERSSKERRDNESYRKDKYKGSPKRLDYRDTSPKRYDSNRSRSPRSPKKLNYKHTDKEKYVRPRASSPSGPLKRYSESPHRRRSRSPYSRRHSPSSHSKRRSRSPHFKKTPTREVRSFRGSSASGSKTRRHSGSPYERDRDYPSSSGHHSGHNRQTYSKKRSRSPYSRKHSQSPHRTDPGYKNKRHSRSPFRRDSNKGRSRSPTRKTNKHSESEERSYHEPSSVDNTEYRGLPTDFEYYGAEGFWIPGPIRRPGFIPRGVLPPMAIPRPMIRPGPSYIIPRQYMPMPPHLLHQFRPRFPVAYNRQYRPRIPAPVVATSSTNTATTSIAVKPTSTSTTTVSTASTSTSANPIIEEPVSESENAESTVQDNS